MVSFTSFVISSSCLGTVVEMNRPDLLIKKISTDSLFLIISVKDVISLSDLSIPAIPWNFPVITMG